MNRQEYMTEQKSINKWIDEWIEIQWVDGGCKQYFDFNIYPIWSNISFMACTKETKLDVKAIVNHGG